MNLTPATVDAIRAELAGAPRGERGAAVKRLAALYGVSPATVYRAAGVRGTARPRAAARPEYRDWVPVAVRIAHQDQPDEPLPLDLAIEAGIESGALPAEAAAMPIATAHRIARELGLRGPGRKRFRMHAGWPMQAVLVDWSSSRYLSVEGPEGDDWRLRMHRRPWSAAGYKNKPLGPGRSRLGVYAIWDMATGYTLARYQVAKGESATDCMEALVWMFEEKADPRLVLHGLPDDLWSDLGPLSKDSPAKDLLRRLQVHLALPEKGYQKQRMGGVERSHRTRWRRFERALFVRGEETILLSELNARLIEFTVRENARRPSRTRVDGRRVSRTDAWSILVRRRPADRPLRHCPPNAIETLAREKRCHVDGEGIIRWDGAQYEAGGGWHTRWVLASRGLAGGDLVIVDEATGAREVARPYADRAYGDVRTGAPTALEKLLDEEPLAVEADIWAPRDTSGIAGLPSPAVPADPLPNPLDADRLDGMEAAMRLFQEIYPWPLSPADREAVEAVIEREGRSRRAVTALAQSLITDTPRRTV